jgi:hypothetical protein
MAYAWVCGIWMTNAIRSVAARLPEALDSSGVRPGEAFEYVETAGRRWNHDVKRDGRSRRDAIYMAKVEGAPRARLLFVRRVGDLACFVDGNSRRLPLNSDHCQQHQHVDKAGDLERVVQS